MTMRRLLRTGLVLVLALGLAACASLPTAGEARPGLQQTGQSDQDTDVTFLAVGPVRGASPETIVRGFIEAGVSPADNWAIAREFLSVDLAQKWKPDAGVTIDVSSSSRRYDAPDPGEGDQSSVRLSLDQTATVDAAGVYSAFVAPGSADLTFQLGKDADGQWRITSAPDGILLEASSFAAADVYSPYSLQYFDPTWTHLVPDVRWFPKRKNTATRIAQALISGKPAPWLAGSVRTAFSGDIALARDAVTVDSQVADVALTAAAFTADPKTLARMRTQLEQSLAAVGVLQVRLTVNGRDLETSGATVASTAVDARPLVLTDAGFGYLSGGDVQAVPGISAQLADFPQQVRSIEASGAADRLVVQAEDGGVYAIADGRVDELDPRPGLVRPALDPFGYVWSVPGNAPGALQVTSTAVVPHPMPGLGDATAVGRIAMSRDGGRLAAVVSAGSQTRVEVLGVARDDKGEPTGLGQPSSIAWPSGSVLDLAWLNDTTLGILVQDGARTVLLEQPIGGPARTTDVASTARSVAAANPTTNVRLLGTGGILWVRSGPTWQPESDKVKILATQLGAP